MRWLLLVSPLRYVWFALGAWLLLMGTDRPDWMSSAQEYALHWRSSLSNLSDPDRAQAEDRQIASRRFDNGEWIFGTCRESMGLQDGGVFVVKDSTGQTRIFMGQGCSGNTLKDVINDAKSLDDFYTHETWTILQFKEYDLP